ncbi:MAG: sigma-54 dependent transcriptional regulator [Pyrinomonadaceae bacterium MAG19_C2-C3]|nr:sigma-54 dependent transcriptional regulator [Pyrinomonadaceae bacterium MAG19_C2-C3]
MQSKIRVLVVDDDAVLRRLVSEQLARSGFEVAVADGGEAALATLRETDMDVVLLDINMPDMSGLDALGRISSLTDAPEVVMLTADTSLTTGIEAMRRGAYDYLTKPATLDEMEAIIIKADEKRRIVRQNTALRDVVAEASAPEDEIAVDAREVDETESPIVHASSVTRRLINLALAAARHDSTILITGESGTGKDVFARFIHSKSARAAAPVITVNCGALPESLFESEFFGHERGAFTGANALKRGLLEAADGATLFLDEIGELPLITQVKLLQFLEMGRFRRLGATRDQAADVRIIAATNRDLLADTQTNRFRADLYYRLNIISLHIPPLRERPEDIPVLTEHFLRSFRTRFNRPSLLLTEDGRQALQHHKWLGNIRELRNTLHRACALATADEIDAASLLSNSIHPATTTAMATETITGTQVSATATTASSAISEASTNPEPATASNPLNHALTLGELERQHILRVLAGAHDNRERAAAILGISARTLYRKLREYEA